jgi:hypothetical protein
LLLPNLGAEEGPVDPARLPAAGRAVAAAWSLLFGDGARSLPGRTRPPWPTGSLGPPARRPALPCLAELGPALAWLPTREADAAFAALGVERRGPAPEVVRRVGDKAFAVEAARRLDVVPPCLAGLVVTLGPEALAAPDARPRLAERLAAWPAWTQGAFTLKPRWGTSGRGRVGGRADRLDRLAPAALARLAERGGAVLEPWLSRTADLSVQLFARADGVEVLGVLRQRVSPAGVPHGSEGVVASGRVGSGDPDEERLASAAQAVADEARRGGFTGPLGVDAFRFVGPDGVEVLRPVVELNPRFTLGTVALGLVARAREAGALRDAGAWRLAVGPAPAGGGEAGLDLGAALRLQLAERAEDLPDEGRPARRRGAGVADTILRCSSTRCGSRAGSSRRPSCC